MDIRLQQRDDNGEVLRVEIIGQLTPVGLHAGQVDPLVALCGQDVYSKRVLMNFSKATYVDSMGVEWLLRSHKKFEEAGGQFVIHSPSETSRQMLNLMRMDLVLIIAADEATALSLGTESQHEH